MNFNSHVSYILDSRLLGIGLKLFNVYYCTVLKVSQKSGFTRMKINLGLNN